MAKCKELRVGLFKCPKCEYKFEIFSDENKVLCPSCGEKLVKSKLRACVEWCAGAKKCIGGSELKKTKEKGK